MKKGKSEMTMEQDNVARITMHHFTTTLLNQLQESHKPSYTALSERFLIQSLSHLPSLVVMETFMYGHLLKSEAERQFRFCMASTGFIILKWRVLNRPSNLHLQRQLSK